MIRCTRFFFLFLALFAGITAAAPARVLYVGTGESYSSLVEAAIDAEPGDTILVRAGTYGGGQFISNVQGTAEQPILFLAEGTVRFEGGTEAWHLTDVAYLHIRGFEFTGQSGNGVNIDDGGSYETPSHHVTVEECYFHDMDASGNNDLLKLSGLDSFQIIDCVFENGADGGSGVDMVGCHYGLFAGNEFSDMGSNCIQAKGGTQFIRIQGNRFVNGGQRSINLGGSTGLEFFRPIDAPFEAADLEVYSNIFIGSTAPVAYVGSTRVNVINNTIWLPEKWVARILQENVDPDRFVASGENAFCNNIVVIDSRVTTQINIGPDTRPETFVFKNNLWHHVDNSSWSGPVLPVDELGGIVGSDPMMIDPQGGNFAIPPTSPAVGKGTILDEPKLDYSGRPFNVPPSIGAYEGNPPTTGVEGIEENKKKDGANAAAQNLRIRVAPNPTAGSCFLSYRLARPAHVVIDLFGTDGRLIRRVSDGMEQGGEHSREIGTDNLSGTLLLRLSVDGEAFTSRVQVGK